jgi:DNA-directed RNA polymerase sigma subunit (sigma70/sigma32)
MFYHFYDFEVLDLLNCIDDRRANIVWLRMNGFKLVEIARYYKLTSGRIQQLEASALHDLRKILKKDNLWTEKVLSAEVI